MQDEREPPQAPVPSGADQRTDGAGEVSTDPGAEPQHGAPEAPETEEARQADRYGA